MSNMDDATVAKSDPGKGSEELGDEEARSIRERTLTEKGKEYTIQMYKSKCSTKKRAWKRTGNDIYTKILKISCIDELHECMHELNTKFGEFYSACEELIGVCPHLNDSIDQELQDCEKFNTDLLKEVNERIKALEHKSDSLSSDDNSNVSNDSKGKQEKAGAEAKPEAVCNNDGEGQLNPSQLDKKEIIQPQTSAEVKAQPVKKELSQPFDVDKVKREMLEKVERMFSELPSKELNPDAKVFSPAVNLQEYNTHVTHGNQTSSTDGNVMYNTQPFPGYVSQKDAMQSIADMMSVMKTREDLPRPAPDVFKGDLLVFSDWLQTFELFIESKTTVPSERLFYLKTYTDGEAKEAISGLLRLKTEEAYVKAKRTLKGRFGNPFLVSNAYRKKLNEWPKIQSNDGPALRKFADFLQDCKTAMETMPQLAVLGDSQENVKLLKKLPIPLVEKWNTIVYKYACRDDDDSADESSMDINGDQYPPFERFCKFIKREATKACNPISSYSAVMDKNQDKNQKSNTAVVKGKNSSSSTDKSGKRSFKTEASEVKSPKAKHENGQRKQCCLYCSEEHDVDVCKRFNLLDITAKFDFVQKQYLCRGCLKRGHKRIDCRHKKCCSICQRYHPTSLHNSSLAQPNVQNVKAGESDKANQSKTNEGSVVSNKINTNQYMTGDMHTMIVPVWLHHSSNEHSKRLVYALLDCQSDACFIKASTLDTLGVSGSPVHLKLSTITGEQTVPCTKISGLVVQGFNEHLHIDLPPTYSKEDIPAKEVQIPCPETAQTWPHLSRISDKLMPYDPNVDVALLIGANCIRAIKPKEIIVGDEDDPYGLKTHLGWGVVGQAVKESKIVSDDVARAFRTIAHEVVINEERKVSFAVVPTQTKELINPMQVRNMFELDFSEKGIDNNPFSYDDKQFLKRMKEGVHQRDGHYELPLPLKSDNIKLPNNKDMAMHRVMKLKAKFLRDRKYHQEYKDFMKDLIDKGYAETVPTKDLQRADGQVWYIPHHGVYHPKKPEKIRVVYDCSASYRGHSLNGHLLQGPDLTNNLVGVLCRFRQEVTAFVCDIEAMYHQVKVNPEHRDMLRFLWWNNGDIDETMLEYRMTAHLFGATSSPSVANFALKQAANDYEAQFGHDAAKFIREDFYVDDGLKSVPSPKDAIDLLMKSKALCKMGGFNLHKFLSNSKEVLAAIAPEEMNNTIKSLDLSKDTLPIERTLGVEWCVESDTFQFRIQVKDKPLTKRGILSTVSSIYDPLGLVSPLILIGKGILQELCREGVSWDDEIPQHVRPQWQQWRDDLHKLKHLKIPRCYKPEGFGKVKKAELHHFSDASQKGYGQCSYIRLTNTADQIHCALVMAKSRVTPLRAITVPRLELTAAVVAVKISAVLKRELSYEDIQEVFWTDSKVVLGYINNDSKRFHVYVANRVQQIRDQTAPRQWKYVETKNNPADYASRGQSVEELTNNDKWWNGPDFLWQHFKVKDDPSESHELEDDDPEVKRVASCATQAQEPFNVLERLNCFSDWFHMKRAIAVCLRLQRMYKKDADGSYKGRSQEYTPLTVQELKDAENEIIRQVQAHAFHEEIKMLKSAGNHESSSQTNRKGTKIRKTSKLHKLDPFIDEEGIIRVGGRIRTSTHQVVKHPAILPKNSHVTDSVICHYHKRVHHQGRGITLNEIRASGYWIVGGSSLVARHVFKCVVCRRVRSETQGQKMADLPQDRLEPSPPFTYAAVDFFGPFYVKEGRKELKRYGVLFTCMVSRAVHLETANSLDTNSFLCAYRRFIGRRGQVRQLRSDQGTNFVGAKNELANALREMDEAKLTNELLKDNCDWVHFKMNVPHASHMGGAWERQIRTVRSILSVLLDQHGSQLDDETLRTFMIEAEAVVNGRPLTVDNFTSPTGVEPLTPNNLLTMKSKIVMPPPGKYERVDLYSRKRWRRVQFLANEFWSRWKREVLQSLQLRNKWQKPQRNLSVGDIVIVKDDNLARNQWKLGRISECFPSDDGLVRKVKVMMSDSCLDNSGKRTKALNIVDGPVHSLVLLLECNTQEDQGSPTEEPK